KEQAVLPAEERVKDFQHLVLHSPPEILRRDGPHLHQDLSVTHVWPHALPRLFVLPGRDLAVAQEELSERLLGRVGGGEDDLAVLPVDAALELIPLKGQLPCAADQGDETEDVRQLDAREIALKDRCVRHSGPWSF